jgi:hypothetical protein
MGFCFRHLRLTPHALRLRINATRFGLCPIRGVGLRKVRVIVKDFLTYKKDFTPLPLRGLGRMPRVMGGKEEKK